MREVVKRRKNFLPTLIIALTSWCTWLFILLKIPPQSPISFLTFYLFLFLALFLSLALFLGNSRRGLLISLSLISFLLLRQTRLASALNLILLTGSVLSLEIYLSRK